MTTRAPIPVRPARPMRPRATQKTYSHLLAARRMPTEYELVSTGLNYYAPRGGLEVSTPVGDWYAEHQRGSPLVCGDWDAFSDPRATTYTSYTALQKTREAFVDGIFESMERGDYEASLAAQWTTTLAETLFPLRHAWHGLGMAAAYVGQMAPGGRITIAALFQSADETRRIERAAYRMALFGRARPLDPNGAMNLWMNDPRWQPMREAIERLLVAYDWGESFVALNLCLKPALDESLHAFAATAKRNGDYLLAEVLGSFEGDAEWQRAWSVALVKVVAGERAENVDAMTRWASVWRPRALAAASAFASIFEPHDAHHEDAIRRRVDSMIAEITAASNGDSAK